MSRRHPSRKHLAAWLAGDLPDLDQHIDGCDRCANRLEDLATPGVGIGDALRRAFTPPADLGPRLSRGIAHKMQTRQDVQALVDLLGLPLHTARALSENPE